MQPETEYVVTGLPLANGSRVKDRRGHHGLHRVNSPAESFEPRRDWQLSFITGHRLRIVTCMVIMAAGFYILQGEVWQKTVKPQGVFQGIWTWLDVLWLGAVLPGLLGFFGMITYRHPRDLDAVARISQFVSFRIVTKGANIDAVRSTIQRCLTEMEKTPLFDFVVEVVTEENTRLDLLPVGDKIRYLIIPDEYSTPKGSMYKARALQFALEASDVPDEAWIVHLDEETQPTSSGIKGICQMIQEEEESGELRVGQGAILYHRDWKKHPFLTLADNVRTGDDFARFHFQHRLGRTVFGLHGSYIVVRSDVAKIAGFDFGPVGSITEDAFWALILMQNGVRARWVKGYLEEQSTQSIKDFLRQRRRWFQGLVKVSLFAPVKARWRMCLGINTFLWAWAPFSVAYTIAHFFIGFEVATPVRVMADLSLASFATLYLTGLKANLDEHGISRFDKRVGWTIAQVLLLPVFSLMEATGVAYAMIKPGKGFHVITK